MHVRTAYEIFNHQQKQKADAKSSSSTSSSSSSSTSTTTSSSSTSLSTKPSAPSAAPAVTRPATTASSAPKGPPLAPPVGAARHPSDLLRHGAAGLYPPPVGLPRPPGLGDPLSAAYGLPRPAYPGLYGPNPLGKPSPTYQCICNDTILCSRYPIPFLKVWFYRDAFRRPGVASGRATAWWPPCT